MYHYTLADLCTMFERITLDSGNECKYGFKLFAGERFKYGFTKSFMSSIMAPQKIQTLTEFGFAPESLFLSIS